MTFQPNQIQIKHLNERGEHGLNKILKARQQGFTTLYCIDYLDDTLWNPGIASAILSHDREHLDKIFQIIKRAYENLPQEIKPETRQDTLRSYKFKTRFDGKPLDSEIYVALKIRGGTVQRLHISERAYIQGEDSVELEAGSKQAVPIGGCISEETTANGLDEFHDSYTAAMNNLSPTKYDYKAYFYAWHENKEYELPGKIEEYTNDDIELKKIVKDAYNKDLRDEQLLWYNWKRKDIEASTRSETGAISLNGKQLMKQEYPSSVLEAFQSAAGNVFDLYMLAGVKAKEPALVPSKAVPGQKIRQWYAPEAGKQYFLGCDPSDGVGGSNGAIALWDQDMKKCAEWIGQLRPDVLAVLIKEMAELYNNAFAGVENNMLSTILFLSKIYHNYYMTVTFDERNQRRTKKIGWTTTSKSRDIMIDDYKMNFEEGSLEINSNGTVSEMQTFVYKENARREAADGKKDDLLFADFIALQMLKNKNKSRNANRVFAKPSSFQ